MQFFLPGIPQVYYVGLLAGGNDMELLARSGVGRDINRHYYSPAEIADAAAQPVVQDLLRLIRLRNTHAAFGGKFALRESPANTLSVAWRAGEAVAELVVDFAALDYQLVTTNGAERTSFHFTTAQHAD